MEAQPEDDAALKRRLIGRIGIAVVVLAGLLVSLAVFDRLNAPEAPENPAASAPPRRTPAVDTIKSETTRPDTGATDPVTAATVPEGSAGPRSTVPLAGSGDKPLTVPATGKHALMRAPDPVVPAATRPDLARPPAATAPITPGSAPLSQSRPLAQTAERPFALQLGVFSDVANAEELRAKLEKAGIRASIEARVRVGPFATRAEADTAREKLRQLGISEAVLLSMKGRKSP